LLLIAFISSLLKNSVELALIKTRHAFNAFFLINNGNFFLFPGDGFHRAGPEAKPAFGAAFGLNFKF
jgi:hypothetical protein